MATSKPSEQSLFLAALELPTPGERAAYLRGACGDDPARRAAVEALLAAHERSENVLDAPPAPAAAPGLTSAYQSITEVVGTLVGPYKLLQQIGEGGFGVVFMAEQEQPVRRKVALKIIKPGMDTKEVIARFESERQALALMDHPNIARVLDTGATDSGRPFFVMELVHGVPITRFCDEGRLTPRERLELFVQVCHAIQHAHQKGIIHRDIKPSNVLVTMYDDKPVPKVIDFGVAKAVEQRLTERTVFTQFGTMVGTFEYMSPEQAAMNAFGVDTRSDIYSLGVLLYELLTGTTPLERKRLRAAALDELLRLIKEEEPPRPSTRLSTARGLAAIAAARKTEPARLSRLVRGEVDWIVMKCLEKDRTRRYETANGLARDIDRHLRDEAVEACPPSAGYRLKKLARKHRGALAVAASVAALLVAGAAVSTWQAVVATRAKQAALAERDRAARAEGDASRERDRAVKERARAEQEAAVAEAVNNFLEDDLLAQASLHVQAQSKQKPDPDIKVRTVLDRAARGIEGKFRDQPLVEASIRSTIGWTYKELGQLPAAQIHLERALELYRRERGAEHGRTLQMHHRLAAVYIMQGNSAQAERACREGLETARRALGDDHPTTLIFMTRLAYARIGQGDYAAAEQLSSQVLSARRRLQGEEHRETIGTMALLGEIYLEQGKFAEAETILIRVYDFHRRPGADRSRSWPGAAAAQALAFLYSTQGQYARAEPLFLEALEVVRRFHGEEHFDHVDKMMQLGEMYRRQHKTDQAEKQLRQALEIGQRVLGEEHVLTLRFRENLATVYLDQGKYAEAEALLREGLRIREGVKDRHSFSRKAHYLGVTQSLLGGSLLGQKKYAEAEPLLLEGYHGIKTGEQIFPLWYRMTWLLGALERLVQLYDAWGKPDEAARWRKKLEEAKAAPQATARG
jgi:serine/threonine protein kinase